ncbi:hypothetical protein [Nonomuraea sp. NPDC048826]|uniref:hypothetical protein n=1 Tax=Nonomuraea sp. NPDC048826 TaxID=3364347 RepID=UPI0037237960
MSDGYDVLLRDGGIAHVRPLRPGDRTALHELVERSSERSAYLRFCTGGRNTAHAYMRTASPPTPTRGTRWWPRYAAGGSRSSSTSPSATAAPTWPS